MTAFEGTSGYFERHTLQEPDVSEIVREDILRILCERSDRMSLETIKDEIKVAHSLISEILEELEKDNLVEIHDNFVSLTKLGQENAKNILEKHLVLEEYFEKTRTEIGAHNAAHILEHYVSGEVVSNIKKLSTLKKGGLPLTEFGFNKEGLITDLVFSDYRLFERIVSMGIFLGERIVITNEIPCGIIVKIGSKKFALDKIIAEEIEAVEYGKT